MDVKKNIPQLSVVVDEYDIQTGAVKILAIIRPNWNKEDIQFKLLTDGITNKLIGCKLRNLPEDETVLIRIYGNKTDMLIDRKAETRNIILLNNVGLAPHLYATFSNGLAYAFIPGCTLNTETVTESQIYSLVAEKMAQLHKVKDTNSIDKKPTPILWKKLQSFIDLIPDVFSDPIKQKKYEETIMSKQQIQMEVDYIKEKLMNVDNPIVFAHNDLLLGNIIFTETKNLITFIDYEYASFNYQAYDIGNHFTEFSGVTNMDVSKYPSKELQYEWLKKYLITYKETENISDDEINNLYALVNQFALVAYLFWSVWGLIQTEHSYLDFDFLEFSSIKFNEYKARKDEFLSLNITR